MQTDSAWRKDKRSKSKSKSKSNSKSCNNAKPVLHSLPQKTRRRNAKHKKSCPMSVVHIFSLFLVRRLYQGRTGTKRATPGVFVHRP